MSIVPSAVENKLSIDFLLLADRAEAINGKLYVMGGAWEQTQVPDLTQPIPISFAVGILVPWNATNEKHTLVITIEDVDGHPLDFRLEVGFSAGRHPLAVPGVSQRVILAMPVVPIAVPGYGEYVVAAHLNGVRSKQVSFTVVGTSQAPVTPEPPPAPNA